jgi:diguanylate cyclase (GGDEF)-like protein
VAQHKVPMDTADYIREMRQTGVSLEVGGHFRFRTDLCAPMIHESRVMGVISVGGIARHYKYEKTILSLIADLGSIALHNHALFSQVQENANLDGLTRLYNKRFFMERLADEMTRADKAHQPVSLFLFDLDNFKQYNDREGHQAGDEVLRITGRLLRDMVRPDDIAARYGGEEFVVILPHTHKDGAVTFAERVRQRIAAHDFPNAARQPLGFVSLSGGVATRPDDGADGQGLIAAADAALYRAKRKGRNRVEAAMANLLSGDEEDLATGTGQG